MPISRALPHRLRTPHPTKTEPHRLQSFLDSASKFNPIHDVREVRLNILIATWKTIHRRTRPPQRRARGEFHIECIDAPPPSHWNLMRPQNQCTYVSTSNVYIPNNGTHSQQFGRESQTPIVFVPSVMHHLNQSVDCKRTEFVEKSVELFWQRIVPSISSGFAAMDSRLRKWAALSCQW